MEYQKNLKSLLNRHEKAVASAALLKRRALKSIRDRNQWVNAQHEANTLFFSALQVFAEEKTTVDELLTHLLVQKELFIEQEVLLNIEKETTPKEQRPEGFLERWFRTSLEVKRLTSLIEAILEAVSEMKKPSI